MSPAPSASVTPTPLANSASTGATFAASWPAIQAALDRNDLKQAHQLLSKWHGDESLSPAESQKVETLLNQLAGTLIYSADNQLEPAHVVKQNETLETIAKEYNVPWQLLAKINGIAAADQLRPGQQLKVVRGPFSAVVSLHRNALTLEIGGNYAGTFAVTVPPGTTVPEGQWLVDQKLAGLQGSFRPSATPVTNDRTIILRDASGTAATSAGTMLMIASTAAVGPPGAASIRVSPQDAEDLADILSIGSRVSIRR
jgi:LysM repeat protein